MIINKNKIKNYFEDVEVINGLKVEYVEDLSHKRLCPPDIYMNYKIKDTEDVLMKEIKGFGIYGIEIVDEGLISSKFMVIKVRYRKLVRVVLNIEREDGIIIHSEVLDRFKGCVLEKELKPIDFYVPSKEKIRIDFNKGKTIVVKYKNIDSEISKLDDTIKGINGDLKNLKGSGNIISLDNYKGIVGK